MASSLGVNCQSLFLENEISLQDAAFLKTKLYANKMQLYCLEKIVLLNQTSLTHIKYNHNIYVSIHTSIYR